VRRRRAAICSTRASLRAYVAARVPDLEVRSGGSTSVDVTRKGVDKSYGMNRIKERLDLADADILFIGDRLDEGGNDYPVKAMGIQCIAVKEWHDTAEVVRGLIAQLSATGGSADRIGASALSPTPS
jgi:phosphomannomutase